MKKRLLLLLFIISPLVSEAQTQLKYATVRVQEIFDAMPQTEEANKALAELAQKYEKEAESIKIEYKNKYTDYVESREGMPENIRARREQELLTISQAIEDFMTIAQNDIKEQQTKLLTPIKEKIQSAINQIGAEGEYHFIIDESQLLYKGANFDDITPFVKAKLDL